MDTQKEHQMAQVKALSELAGKKTVVGAKQLRKALNSGLARRGYLACNADPAITEPLEEKCKVLGVPFLWVGTMAELGSACGIEVGAAAAAAINS